MYRFLFFLITILLPIMFGWWLFLPLTIISIYLTKLPYEIIIAGIILDSLYYFGDNFFYNNQLALFAILLISVALFLNDKVYWNRLI